VHPVSIAPEFPVPYASFCFIVFCALGRGLVFTTRVFLQSERQQPWTGAEEKQNNPCGIHCRLLVGCIKSILKLLHNSASKGCICSVVDSQIFLMLSQVCF
jgi:hypothetical protein